MLFTQSSFHCLNHSTQNCLNMTLRSLTCGSCLWRSWAWAAFPWRELLGLFWAARRIDACWRRSSWWQARAGRGWRCGGARSALRSAGWSVSGPPTPGCWCRSSPVGTELQQKSNHYKLQNNDGTPKAKWLEPRNQTEDASNVEICKYFYSHSSLFVLSIIRPKQFEFELKLLRVQPCLGWLLTTEE